jgi:hypothetical protein
LRSSDPVDDRENSNTTFTPTSRPSVTSSAHLTDAVEAVTVAGDPPVSRVQQ